jgi:3-phenylpropionate/trans-cinnamate dioxygenase ferredoxin reductase subunit
MSALDSAGMLIVGAGLAGLTVAETLRAEGYAGPITLLGDEPHAPYQRPPLSKGFLLGETAEAQLMMRTAGTAGEEKHHAESRRWRHGDRPRAKQVTLVDGSTLAYDGLALCTGSRLRPLPLAGCRPGRRVRPAFAG